jgi:hypothetical protein
MPTDIAILINMVFNPSHCDAEMNRRTIAASGVAQFTKSCFSTLIYLGARALVSIAAWRRPMPR